MQVVHIRKRLAGHASSGYTWPEDGAVIPVKAEHAAELLRIRDAEFEEVAPEDLDEPVKRGPGRPRKTL